MSAMPTASVRPQNSTTVRATPATVKALRTGFRFFGPRAPELAARYAERLFLTARKHDRPAREREILGTAERGTIALDGGLLPTWSWGPRSAPTVLLVHGWEGRGSQLASFVDPLLERGFRVVTFDAPGHGESTLRVASAVEHARGVAAVVQSLGAGRVHAVVAHSVGGAATLLATRAGVRASRLALIAPPVGPARFAAGFAETFGLDARTRDALISRLESRYGLTLRDLEVTHDAARLDMPLLVIHDEGDRIVPEADGIAIATAGRSGRLVTTRGLGHHRILRDEHVVDEVVRFVASGAGPYAEASFAETIDGELFHRDLRW